VSVPDIIAEWDTDSDAETLHIKNSTVISGPVDFQRQDQSMNDNNDDNAYERSATDTSNSGIESEEDVVKGTPERCQVS